MEIEALKASQRDQKGRGKESSPPSLSLFPSPPPPSPLSVIDYVRQWVPFPAGKLWETRQASPVGASPRPLRRVFPFFFLRPPLRGFACSLIAGAGRDRPPAAADSDKFSAPAEKTRNRKLPFFPPLPGFGGPRVARKASDGENRSSAERDEAELTDGHRRDKKDDACGAPGHFITLRSAPPRGFSSPHGGGDRAVSTCPRVNVLSCLLWFT